MKKVTVLASSTLLALMLAAPPAGARNSDPAASAELSEPVRRSVERPVAGGHVWTCRGTECTGRAPEADRGQIAACRALARNTGSLVAFRVGDREFSAAELERCNGR